MAKSASTDGTEETPRKKGGIKTDTSWHDAFLEEFAKSGIVGTACRVTGVNRSTAYRHRDSDEEFAKQWHDAEEAACDLLEEEAKRRAFEGTEKAVFYEGKRVDDHDVKQYHDTLLIFLLKARRPHKYRDHYQHEITGPAGGALQINIVTATPPVKDADSKPKGDG